MAEKFARNSAKANQAAQRLDQAWNVIKGLEGRLQGHKADLDANWQSGAAKPTFDQVYNDFIGTAGKNNGFNGQGLEGVLQALQDMHERLSDTNKNYTNMHQQQEETVNRVKSLINDGGINHSGLNR